MTAVQFCQTVVQAAADIWDSQFSNPKIPSILMSSRPSSLIPHWMDESWATEICSAVVSTLEKPSEGIKQLQNNAKPDEIMKVRQESRAWYLLEGDQHGHRHRSLKVALKKVCHNECEDLVKKLKNKPTIMHLLHDDHYAHDTMEERCAKLVVREVESETLGCCARSCGWNGAACGLWDFMIDEEKQDWKLECCAEGAILNGSFASQPGVLRSRKFPSVCVISGPMSL